MFYRKLFKLNFLALSLSLALFNTGTAVLAADTTRDCDSNAVVMCGVMSTSELQSKYNSTPSVQTIFHNFGITHIDVNAMHTTAVTGEITKGGRVLVNGNEVATGAMTAGMQDMAGSQKVTANGTTFFVRSPSVSFNSSSLPAFVVMKNGQFVFAVIKSCGNPVKANAVTKQTAQPAAVQPTTPTPVPTPTPPVVLSQTQNQSQQVTVNTPTPAPAPQPAPAARIIPNTGSGDVAGIGVLAAVPSTIAHYIYRRRKILS
jgi:hypothetical protein